MPSVDGWPPRWWTRPPGRLSRGPQAREFIETFCRTTKTTIAGSAGDLLVLRPWQVELLDSLLAERPDGTLRHRQGLIGLPRKNGKSALGAGLGLWGLFLGPAGGEVYSVAGDREQARIVFGMARRMVQLDGELSARVKVYRDAIEDFATGSVYRVLSSDAPLKEGLSPTLVLFDEVHVQPDDELWSVMNLGTGARLEPLVLGITTAGAKQRANGPTLCYRLYEYGQRVARGEVEDPSFFFAWWEPAAGVHADYRDPAVLREANPAFGDLVAAEDFVANYPPKVPEHEFRNKRTNVWSEAASESWLSEAPGAWERCESAELLIEDCDRIVAAVDMSLKNDRTAVVFVGSHPSGRTVVRSRVFAAPPAGRIDFGAVRDHVVREAVRLSPASIVYDPRFFEVIAQQLADDGLPMVEFPQSPERMIPACGHAYSAIVGGDVAHDGDPTLADHVRHAIRRETERGWTLSKGRSRAPIDACVAMVMGLWELTQEPAVTSRPVFAY